MKKTIFNSIQPKLGAAIQLSWRPGTPANGDSHPPKKNTLVNAVDSDGHTDGIRLRQAYLTGDTKATPIVPSNKRFAEVVVDPSATSAPGTNPKLYRVSNGHGGVMCEGCHGSTHAIWPNANPNANDNLTASQLQGHTGPIVECNACHGTTDLGNTLDGPHGMHPVGNTGFARGGVRRLFHPAPGAASR